MAIPVHPQTVHYQNRHSIQPESNRAFVWGLFLVLAVAIAAYAAYEVYSVQPTDSSIVMQENNDATSGTLAMTPADDNTVIDNTNTAAANDNITEDTGSRTGPLPQ